MPSADVIYAMDRKFWNEYGERLPSGPELWTTNREAARLWSLNHINGEPGGGVSERKNTIRFGGNSGFQALGLALHFGAERIALLGYDMQLTDGKTHWHGDHKVLGNPTADNFKQWRKRFAEIPDAYARRVVNASRVSALECFTKVDLDAFVNLP